MEMMWDLKAFDQPKKLAHVLSKELPSYIWSHNFPLAVSGTDQTVEHVLETLNRFRKRLHISTKRTNTIFSVFPGNFNFYFIIASLKFILPF